jgi:hypothetical protein
VNAREQGLVAGRSRKWRAANREKVREWTHAAPVPHLPIAPL